MTSWLAVIVAVALGVWLWVDRDTATTSETAARGQNVFPVWRKEELSQVTLAHDGETVVLERHADTWRVNGEPADGAAVDRLLHALEFAKVARAVSESPELGFETPRATGTLRMKHVAHAFALGGVSARPQDSRYFRAQGRAPFVVEKDLVDALLAPGDTYRERNVMPYRTADFKAFILTNGERHFAFESLDERAWKLSDSGLLASRDALARIDSALASMRAKTFPKDASDAAARAPLMLSLTPREGPPIEIRVGPTCPGSPDDCIVHISGPSKGTACVSNEVLRMLNVNPDDLVEKHPMPWAMDEIEEIRLESGPKAHENALEIARKNKGFHQRFPDDRELDTGEVDAATAWLTSIHAATASSVTRSTSGFQAEASARFYADGHEFVIEVGPRAADGSATLRRVIDDARLAVDAATRRLFVRQSTTLRAPTLAPGATPKAKRIHLRCGTEQELADEGEGFRYVTPKGLPADASIVQLIDGMAPGHVTRWVADEDDGTFGFRANPCQVQLTFASGNEPLTVTFGARAEGGVYGQTSSQKGVFVAPEELLAKASRIYVDLASLRSEAKEITRVHVSRLGREVAGETNVMRDAVAALYADRVVSLGTRGLSTPTLLIDAWQGDATPPRHVACRPAPKGNEHWCTRAGVDATFAVRTSLLARFVETP
jgi:hypothetical protein